MFESFIPRGFKANPISESAVFLSFEELSSDQA